jgi:hypothetical protein
VPALIAGIFEKTVFTVFPKQLFIDRRCGQQEYAPGMIPETLAFKRVSGNIPVLPGKHLLADRTFISPGMGDNKKATVSW